MASAAQQIRDAIVTALLPTPLAEGRVYKSRVTLLTRDETPAINVKRGDQQLALAAFATDQVSLAITIDLYVRAVDDWEAECDALHVQVQGVLAADSTIKALTKGSLHLAAISPTADSADGIAGLFSCRYECTFFSDTGSLAAV